MIEYIQNTNGSAAISRMIKATIVSIVFISVLMNKFCFKSVYIRCLCSDINQYYSSELFESS